MSLQSSQQTKTQSISRLRLSARSIFSGEKLFSVLAILLIYVAMILTGVFENASELSSLLAEGALSESFLVNILSLLADPVISSQLLIGLCWLIFLFFPAHRAAVVLYKATLAFRETLQSFIEFNTHGCRAPPQVNG